MEFGGYANEASGTPKVSRCKPGHGPCSPFISTRRVRRPQKADTCGAPANGHFPPMNKNISKLSHIQQIAHHEYLSAVSLYRTCSELYQQLRAGNRTATSRLVEEAYSTSYHVAWRALDRTKRKGLKYAEGFRLPGATELVSWTNRASRRSRADVKRSKRVGES